MIDRVRNTVLQIINKENRGYLSPSEFNRLAEMAQLDIFEQYFSDFNNDSAKMNANLMDDEEGNLMERRLDVIESFSKVDVMPYDALSQRHEFPGFGASAGKPKAFRIQKIYNAISGDIYNKLSKKEYDLIKGNPNLAPTSGRGYHYRDESGVKVLPASTSNDVMIDYIRHPHAPKWTYNVIANNPVFDNSKSDYQDFELPPVDMPKLVVGILKLLGISIREADVVAAVASEESLDKQQKA